MEKKRKKRKLLVQIIAITVPVFVIMMIAIIWSVYESATNGFVNAKKSHMEYVLKECDPFYQYFDTSGLAWYFDMWEKYPELLKTPATKEEVEAFEKETCSDDFEWDDNWRDELSEDARRYEIKMIYETNDGTFSYYAAMNDYEKMFIIDVKEGYEGLVLFEFSRNNKESRVGRYYDLDLDEHTAIKRLVNSKDPEKMSFERTRDFPDEGSYYIGYKPIIVDDEVRAVIGVMYKWDDFRHAMKITIRNIVLVGAGGMLLALALLQLMLYIKAIKPIASLQDSVQKYRDDKDSEAVVKRASDIKVKNEIGVLSDNIAELAVEMDQYTEENIRLVGEKERVSAELDMARKIQKEQLPNVFPAFPERDEFDIYASMTPAKEVGGDFYDFFFIDDDHLALVIADVSGKGVPAALFMMMSKMLINNYAMMGLTPHEVLEKTNDTICKNNKQKMFVTVWFGIYELSTGKITASNAGHEYPVIRRPDGQFEIFKEQHGFVIGGKKNMKYRDYEFTLEEGSTIFVYTDGIPEATDAQEKMFGMDRLLEALNSEPEAAPEKLTINVNNAVNTFVKDAPQFDDLTMLAVKRRK